MSSYDVAGIPAVSFKILPTNGRFPGLRNTSMTEPPVYAATIRVVGSVNRQRLLHSRSFVENWRRPYGADGWDAYVDSGPGAGPLTVPLTRGRMVSWAAAILTSTQDESEPSMMADVYYIQCEWRVLDPDPFPG